MKKIRLFEMFSGFGGASFALKKAGIPFECIGYSEIDKYAVKCYEQNHIAEDMRTQGFSEMEIKDYLFIVEDLIKSDVTDVQYNFGDCTKINPNDIPDFDLLTGGFPCQSFSVAGKGLGELDTRGTLFNEIIRIAEFKHPKFMLLENVKGLVGKKHKATFEKILSELERIGYYVDWKVLNSKEYGIPQNRERVFFKCYNLVKCEGLLIKNWPEKEELNIFLKDILEESVDEKYYLSEKMIEKLSFKEKLSGEVANLNKGGERGSVYSENVKYMSCLSATDYKQPKQIIQLNSPSHSNNRVYSVEGISPTLNTMGGGNRQPFIVASRGRNPLNPTARVVGDSTVQMLEPKFDGTTNCLSTVQKDNYVCIVNATKKGYLEAKEGDGVNLEQPNSKTRRGRVQKGLCSTLQCNDARCVVTRDFRIRKLTPTECFRLMGFLNDEINLEGISNSQKYRLAGNGWDINLVSKIFKGAL